MVILIAAVNARFVRIKIDMGACSANYPASVYELQVLAAIPSEVCRKTLTVSGAGTAAVNGVYFEDGTSDGVPRYTLPPRAPPGGDSNPVGQTHAVGEGGISVLRWTDGTLPSLQKPSQCPP